MAPNSWVDLLWAGIWWVNLVAAAADQWVNLVAAMPDQWVDLMTAAAVARQMVGRPWGSSCWGQAHNVSMLLQQLLGPGT